MGMAGPSNVAGPSNMSQMPAPAPRPRGPKLKFTPEDDQLLVDLKENKALTWKQIAEFFPGRSSGTLQVRYCTKLKAKTTQWTDETVRTPNPFVKAERFAWKEASFSLQARVAILLEFSFLTMMRGNEGDTAPQCHGRVRAGPLAFNRSQGWQRVFPSSLQGKGERVGRAIDQEIAHLKTENRSLFRQIVPLHLWLAAQWLGICRLRCGMFMAFASILFCLFSSQICYCALYLFLFVYLGRASEGVEVIFSPTPIFGWRQIL